MPVQERQILCAPKDLSQEMRINTRMDEACAYDAQAPYMSLTGKRSTLHRPSPADLRNSG
jgi:hypothetical protein